MKHYIGLFLKGIGMGAANVIPGVSGGTIALITGIFEELIDAIKSFNIQAAKLLLSGRFRAFAEHINLFFLLAVFTGIAASIFTLAVVLDYLFVNYPTLIWSFFFGLILASVYFVGKTIGSCSTGVIIAGATGTAAAVLITLLKPATENGDFSYLMICGVVAICSMILPGLSGSFVLILMGNYQLVMIDAVKNLDFLILLPVAIGAGVGLIGFSHALSWVFKKFKDQTIALLAGFILGSLAILWPWKHSFDQSMSLIPANRFGAFLDPDGRVLEDMKVFGYEQCLPQSFTMVEVYAILLMLAGIGCIWLLEKTAAGK